MAESNNNKEGKEVTDTLLLRVKAEKEIKNVFLSMQTMKALLIRDLKRMSKNFHIGVFIHPIYQRVEPFMINYSMERTNNDISLGYLSSNISNREIEAFKTRFNVPTMEEGLKRLRNFMQNPKAREWLAKTLLQIGQDWSTHTSRNLGILDNLYRNIDQENFKEEENELVELRLQIFHEPQFLLDLAQILLRYRFYHDNRNRLMKLKCGLKLIDL